MFRKFELKHCVLCGTTENLSGEHKIKRSLISSEFGNDTTYIGNLESGERFRAAQSPRSKSFHYKVRLCTRCNGERTQSADRAFDRFHNEVAIASKAGLPLDTPLTKTEYANGTPEYLNVFRFFAKHLCCHIAETEGPIPIRIAHFAIGQNNINPISINILDSYNFEEKKKFFNEPTPKHAGHGGLIIYCKSNNGSPTGFQSSLEIGKVQYVYWARMNWLGQLALRTMHSSYYKWCKHTATQNRITNDTEKRRHGFRD